LEKFGDVAYILDLPSYVAIHSFSCLQLKKKLGKDRVIQVHRPSYFEEIVEKPKKILDRRSV